MEISKKKIRENIYMSLLNYKKPIQSLITNFLYTFKYNKKNINDYIEPQIKYIFERLIIEFNSEFGIDPKNFWDFFRFYLKGGKALNKLIKKICIENKNKILSSTNELLKSVDKCFVNRGLFFNTNTDYDFTMLVKTTSEKEIEKVNKIILQVLNEVQNNLENNNEFMIWSNKFLESVNKVENLKKIYKTIEESKKEIENDIFTNKIVDPFIKNYLILKTIQIEKFLDELKLHIDLEEDFFINQKVRLTYSSKPIEINLGENIDQIFYLFRLKFFIETPIPLKKLNRDIKDYVSGYPDYESIPFDNIFGELIDISLQIGDKQTIDEMWKNSEKENLLRPVKHIDNINLVNFYNYPVVSLKYQLKDVIFIFNVPNPLKLSKRCERFLEYIKMFCYQEEVPNEFSIVLSDELQKQIQAEIKSKNKNCYKMVEVLKLLSENRIDENEFLLTKKQLQNIFPEFCKSSYNINFKDKDKIIENILSLKQDVEIDKDILNKINYLSLKKLYSYRDNKELFYDILNQIKIFNPISRIIPIELDI
jgi:hypothetical protein